MPMLVIPSSEGRPEPESVRITEPSTGRKKAHTAKWDRCVRKVKAKGGGYNPYAVCTDSIKYKDAFLKSSRDRAKRKKS